jgi:hypothetical protein
MKNLFLILTLFFLCKTSTAQEIKSFDCEKSYEDSFINVYSIRIKIDQQMSEDNRINIVKDELEKRFQVQTDKILNIDALGSKKYKTYQYKVRVSKK